MKDTKTNKQFKTLISLIYAPLSGKVVPLESLKDPIFATKALGDGVAINPENEVVVSPCRGVVKFIHSNNHVIILESQEGFEILIHIGINTKNLPKDIYTTLVKVGSKVNVGNELIKFNKQALISMNKSACTAIVVNNLNEKSSSIKLLNITQNVLAGKDLLYVAGKEEVLETPEFKEFFEQLSNDKSLDEFTKEVTIINSTGLHARPAAFLVNLAKKYSTTTVTIKKNSQTANAKSLIEILGLSINYKDKITLIVKGENAEVVFNALVDAFKSGLGEEVKKEDLKTLSNNVTSIENVDASMHSAYINSELVKKINSNEKSLSVNGTVIYPGIVLGKAFLVKNQCVQVPENSTLTPKEESSRLLDAISKVKCIIQEYIREAKEMNKVSQVEIFTTHLEVLKDDFLLKAASEAIKIGKTAEFAFKVAAEKTCSILFKTQNTLLKERIADIKDIEKSIHTVLLGKEIKNIIFPENSIIISEDLTPSQITSFNENVKGVVLAKGSSTSHISIMLKNDGIPSMVSLGLEVLSVKNGIEVILNSKEGTFIINPTDQEKQNIISDIKKLTETKINNLAYSKEKSITTDGVVIKVLGNVGSVEQALEAYDMGGEGIGLVRSEFLFMNTTYAPSEEAQYKIYQDICSAMHGYSIIVRTLDAGGDKPISYINLPNEENPIMGLRGVRNYHLNKEIFHSQLRALLRVKPLGSCKIMIPMVSEVGEILRIKDILNEEKRLLGINGKIELGIMVEVPSVALLSKQFAKHVDFLSIGTNDLAQYILAMDRGHDILTKHINNLNPALLNAIYNTCKGAQELSVPVGVCGAMASEVESIPILIGLGVTSLSCVSKVIPDIKALIRKLSYAQCKEVAERSLELSNQEEVKEMVYKEFGKYYS